MIRTHLKCLDRHARLQSRFLTIQPRIETHARIYFRGTRCPHQKADRIAESIALAWKWFRRLVKHGKDPTTFVSTLSGALLAQGLLELRSWYPVQPCRRL